MSATGGIVQGIQGAIAYEDYKEELANLPGYREYNPISEYMNLYGRVDRLSRNPYSAASTAGFNSLVAQGMNTGMQQARAVDPSIAGAALAGMNMSGMQQQAQRQVQGDQAMFGYLQMLGGMTETLQGLHNKSIQEYNQRLHTKELSLEQLKAGARQTSEEGWVEWNDQSEAAMAEMFSMMFGAGGGAGAVDDTERTANNSQAYSGGGMYGTGGGPSYTGAGGSGSFYNIGGAPTNTGGSGGQGPFSPSAVGGSGNMGSTGGMQNWGVGGSFCWVARAAYGESDPRWMVFREWMLNEAPVWFRNLYLAHGEHFAEFIADRPVLKRIIRAMMDTVVVPRITAVA